MKLFNSDRKLKVQDCITEILVDEFPLTINELKLRIKEKYSLSVSYQAVHKEVNRLTENGVLQKEELGFILNRGWVMNNIAFFQKADENIQNRKTVRYLAFDFNDTLAPRKYDSLIKCTRKNIICPYQQQK